MSFSQPAGVMLGHLVPNNNMFWNPKEKKKKFTLTFLQVTKTGAECILCW